MTDQRAMGAPCPQLQSIAAYFDEELTASQRRSVEKHVAACPQCRLELKALEILSQRLQQDGWSDTVFSSPATFWTRLAGQLEQRQESSSGMERHWSLLAPLGLVLAGTALSAFGALIALANSAQRWHLLAPAWSAPVASISQQLIGPLAWSAVQQLGSALTSALPKSIDRGSALSLVAQVGSPGVALGLATLYLRWIVWWVRDANRINGAP